MPLNIKNPELERLAAEVARMAGETKTEAIRQALIDRKSRLQVAIGRPRKKAQLLDFLERSVWPKVPRQVLGKPLSRKEEDAILRDVTLRPKRVPFERLAGILGSKKQPPISVPRVGTAIEAEVCRRWTRKRRPPAS